jgi:hypothetical protein
VGLPGSRIASTSLVEGRRATVVGIVKRPYPTATDQRFGVVPRSPADLDLGRAAADSTAPAGSSPTPGPSAAPSGAPAGTPGTPGDPADDIGAPVDVALRDLATGVGRLVRVGGLVTMLEPGGVRLDDGTATALVVLEGEAAGLLALLQPGDTVNATGTPDERDEVVLVVTDPAALVLVGDLGTGGSPSDAPGLAAAFRDVPPVGPPVDEAIAVLDATRDAPPLGVGLGALAFVAGLGFGLAAWRATIRRRRVAARIQSRLEAFAAPVAPPATPSEGAP